MLKTVITIENCPVKTKCPKTWAQLTTTGNPTIRHCQQCEKSVHYCHDQHDIAEAAKYNRCIAVTYSEPSGQIGELLGEIHPDF